MMLKKLASFTVSENPTVQSNKHQKNLITLKFKNAKQDGKAHFLEFSSFLFYAAWMALPPKIICQAPFCCQDQKLMKFVEHIERWRRNCPFIYYSQNESAKLGISWEFEKLRLYAKTFYTSVDLLYQFNSYSKHQMIPLDF